MNRSYLRALAAVRLCVFVTVAAWLATVCGAQSGPAAAGGYRITGRVVNAATGEAVARATISALDEDDSHVVATSLSGEDGGFAIAGLPAGKYPLSAAKRGYRTTFYDQHDDFNTAIVTGEGQDTEHLRFEIEPGAVLHGVITADGGDPVENASVMLFKRPDASQPDQRIAQVDNATTDDTGAYEFADLAPGEYFIAVKAEPWYALHSVASRDAGNASLDVAYPVTFFDSTTDEASASPVPLSAGDRQEADISLHAVPALHLTVPGTKENNGLVELRQTVFGNQIQSRGADMLRVQRGTVEVSGLAPGHYELIHGSPARSVDVNAASDLDIDANAGTGMVTVNGTLVDASGSLVTQDVNLILEPSDSTGGRTTLQTVARQGRFTFSDVAPGAWFLSAFGIDGARELPVTAVATGTQATAGNQISVADQPLTVAVGLSRSKTQVRGFARSGAKPASGVMIFLVPRNPGAYRSLIRRDQSDSDGSFALHDVAPGPYTVIAVEDGWKLDWRSPRALARYVAAGIPVMIPETSNPVVQLSRPVPSVPR